MSLPVALELGFIEASERYTESGMLSEIARSIENGESAKINQKKKQKVIEEEEEGTERNENDDDNDVDDSAGGPNADFISKRAEKRKQILLNKANSIPHLNDSSVDFLESFLKYALSLLGSLWITHCIFRNVYVGALL